MKIKTVLMVFLSISLVVVFIGANFQGVLFNESFYEKEFRKLSMDKRVPEGENITKELLRYYQYERPEAFSIGAFNEEERKHLIDVKIVIDIGKFYFYSLILVILIMTYVLIKISDEPVKDLLMVLQWGSAITIGGIMIMVLFSPFFEYLFRWLHPFFFKGDSWLFPSDALIITIFPMQFSYDFMAQVIMLTGVSALGLFILATTMLYVLLPNRDTVTCKK